MLSKALQTEKDETVAVRERGENNENRKEEGEITWTLTDMLLGNLNFVSKFISKQLHFCSEGNI